MAHQEYDESKALEEYKTRNFWMLMTDLERDSYRLALQREKASHSEFCAERLPRWIATAGAEATERSQVGFRALSDQIHQRIQRDIWAGRLAINRCPQCSRIVKTPLTRQCLWCGYDWHGK